MAERCRALPSLARRHGSDGPRHVAATTRRTAARSILLLGVVAVLAASCGGSDSGDGAQAGRSGNPATTNAGTAPSTATTIAAPKPSPGCGTSTVKAVDAERKTLTIGADERWYLLTTPPAHDGRTPMPLVLDFHGLSEGAEVHAQMSNYGALAKEKGFVVAFPHGQGQPVRWTVKPETDPNPDLLFVDQLLTSLGQELCLDTSRVYSTGLSFGAIMTSFLVCQRADKFAAVAPVAGIQLNEPCNPSRPLPMLSFHGTADTILRFNGGVGSIPGMLGQGDAGGPTTTTTLPPAELNGAGYPATVAAWAKRNGCGTATDTNVTEAVVHRVYDCPEGRDVEFYIVIGGGHAWPGSEFSRRIAGVVGTTTFDIDATRLSWEFFSHHRLP